MDFIQQNGYPQREMQRGGIVQSPPFPQSYGNNNLMMNTPYENYMGRVQQNGLNQYLKCRPVASKEEARAFQIDLDGSLWVFTDVGNGKIYTKQINADGTAAFKTYSFTEDEIPYASSDYVTKQEFNEVVQSLIAAIRSKNVQNENVTKTEENSQLTF